MGWAGILFIVVAVTLLAGIHSYLPAEMLVAIYSATGAVIGTILLWGGAALWRMDRIERLLHSDRQQLAVDAAEADAGVAHLDSRRF